MTESRIYRQRKRHTEGVVGRMIRESIEPGTKVWHEECGIGVFDGWVKDETDKLAIINFGDGRVILQRKDLTEVEE